MDAHFDQLLYNFDISLERQSLHVNDTVFDDGVVAPLESIQFFRQAELLLCEFRHSHSTVLNCTHTDVRALGVIDQIADWHNTQVVGRFERRVPLFVLCQLESQGFTLFFGLSIRDLFCQLVFGVVGFLHSTAPDTLIGKHRMLGSNRHTSFSQVRQHINNGGRVFGRNQVIVNTVNAAQLVINDGLGQIVLDVGVVLLGEAVAVLFDEANVTRFLQCSPHQVRVHDVYAVERQHVCRLDIRQRIKLVDHVRVYNPQLGDALRDAHIADRVRVIVLHRQYCCHTVFDVDGMGVDDWDINFHLRH